MIKASIKKQLNGTAGELLLDLDISITKGSINALFGPSGAGKTSTLRMLSGFMTPDSGTITAGQQTWFDSDQKLSLKPGKRSIGYVFQNLALFPNMSVLENMRYAAGEKQDEALFKELLEVTELTALANQKPHELSGGQQRRAALIRAIAQQPQLLLLDEPFNGLDDKTRLRLQDYLAELHQRIHFTVILVSHDIAEVSKLADHIWHLKNGTLVKSGSPAEVFGLDKAKGQLQIIAKVVAVSKEEICLLVNGSVVKWNLKDGAASYDIGQAVSITLDQNMGTITKLN